MAHFPMTYTLSSGTKVQVTQSGPDTYEFLLTPEEEAPHSFTYQEGERTKAEWDEALEFESLDALREFWLKTEDII